jgi:hypothetical protein
MTDTPENLPEQPKVLTDREQFQTYLTQLVNSLATISGNFLVDAVRQSPTLDIDSKSVVYFTDYLGGLVQNDMEVLFGTSPRKEFVEAKAKEQAELTPKKTKKTK